MNGDNLKNSCGLSKFIETLNSRACWRGPGRHRTWEISIRRSCTNLIQIKLARYRYKQKQKLWTILRTTESYRNQSQQTLHQWVTCLKFLLNALLLFTAHLPSRQTATASLEGYWTCLQNYRSINSVVRVFFTLMQNLGGCCIKQK